MIRFQDKVRSNCLTTERGRKLRAARLAVDKGCMAMFDSIDKAVAEDDAQGASDVKNSAGQGSTNGHRNSLHGAISSAPCVRFT